MTSSALIDIYISNLKVRSENLQSPGLNIPHPGPVSGFSLRGGRRKSREQRAGVHVHLAEKQGGGPLRPDINHVDLSTPDRGLAPFPVSFPAHDRSICARLKAHLRGTKSRIPKIERALRLNANCKLSGESCGSSEKAKREGAGESGRSPFHETRDGRSEYLSSLTHTPVVFEFFLMVNIRDVSRSSTCRKVLCVQVRPGQRDAVSERGKAGVCRVVERADGQASAISYAPALVRLPLIDQGPLNKIKPSILKGKKVTWCFQFHSLSVCADSQDATPPHPSTPPHARSGLSVSHRRGGGGGNQTSVPNEKVDEI